jgi:hypothetical protein
MAPPTHLAIVEETIAVARSNLVWALIAGVMLVCLVAYTTTRSASNKWRRSHQIGAAVLSLVVVYTGYKGLVDLRNAFEIAHNPRNELYLSAYNTGADVFDYNCADIEL